MRRFLVVGCGGSGGQTLAYMMDQLRSELAAHGVAQLPAGWQFVHIDVPTGEGRPPAGIGTVSQQGGRYIGIGPQGGSYPILDTAVGQALNGSGSLESIATWAPRVPDEVTEPINEGAGQYRALGRMITLSKAADIRSRLTDVWEQLGSMDARAEMAALRIPGLGEFNPQEVPVVLVVSSMAGGAGASMALDVCRLLTLIPGVTPGLIGVFAYTADVFATLSSASITGVRANALAMLGEVVASQAEAARSHDVATLGALGQQNGDGAPIPFARIFPVGRYVGVDRTLFGDGSMPTIYRGLGRGLAALMSSGVASQQFVEYDLTNTGSPNGDRNVLGWGAKWRSLPWGAFGFASLSMGRDRYAEYAAQRLARSAVDRLLRGHLQPMNNASSTEQLDALLGSQWPAIAQRMGLPPAGLPTDRMAAAVIEWLTTRVFPQEQSRSDAQLIVDRDLRKDLPTADGNPAADWLAAVRQRTAGHRSAVNAAIVGNVYRTTYDWHHRFVADVERTVAAAMASSGLPYAQAVVTRLRQHLEGLLTTLADLGVRGAGDPVAVPPQMEKLTAGIRGAIKDGHTLTGRLVSGLAQKIMDVTYGQQAALTGQLLGSLCADLLPALTAAISSATQTLERAEDAPIVDAGLARVATDQIPAWPSDAEAMVDPRFDTATNEVLLIRSREFRSRYEVDIQAAVYGTGQSAGPTDAVGIAVGQVIAGVWPTTGGRLPPGGLLVPTVPWRSRVFSSEPGTGRPLTPQTGRFDVHVRPTKLIARTREYVNRPGESFDTFCSLALRDYVAGEGALEWEIPQRRQEIAAKFNEALTLALPLIGVSQDAVVAVHKSPVVYRYKFSDVPFDQMDVADQLVDVLQQHPKVDATARDNLRTALSTTSSTRINIFGSYQNYSPVVFDSVLKPVAEQWSAIPNEGRSAFWQWRRSRPLTASLPMADVERRAMVAGYFIGQLVGQLRIPEAPYQDPVTIWDGETASWVPFPHPLLTPPASFIRMFDWLPAILESSLLAISRCYQQPVMRSMRPYQLLRGLYDDTSQEPAGPIMELSGRRTLQRWLRDGRTGTGATARFPGAAEAPDTVDGRVEAAVGWLDTIHDFAGNTFLPAGRGGAPGGSAFATIPSRAVASQTPIFRDLADDAFWATGVLVGMVRQAGEAAKEKNGPAVPAAGGQDVDSTAQLPDGPVF